jgi:hypothetical protein
MGKQVMKRSDRKRLEQMERAMARRSKPAPATSSSQPDPPPTRQNAPSLAQGGPPAGGSRLSAGPDRLKALHGLPRGISGGRYGVRRRYS